MSPGRTIAESLTKTRLSFFERIRDHLHARGSGLDEPFWQDLEALLIEADLGVQVTMAIVSHLREEVRATGIWDPEKAHDALADRLVELLNSASQSEAEGTISGASSEDSAGPDTENGLRVVLVVGVNGSGKTIGVAKLAHRDQGLGKKVILAAADTFRAAAIEQLKIWGDRLGVHVVAHQHGADAGAVVFDAIEAGRARGAQVLLVDTAGRLHTKHNLMEELRKIRKVVAGQVPGGPHEVVLVLDATTGQNALAQARHFQEAVDVTGVLLAKMDGSARGGMAFAIASELGIPVRYVGTGESLEDLRDFDPRAFVSALLEPAELPASAP
ncbi:MAG: signal recognition particle-docking protein FtsY [Anaerolineae bacterium]